MTHKALSPMVIPWGIYSTREAIGDLPLFESGAAIFLESMAVFLEFWGFDFPKMGKILTHV